MNSAEKIQRATEYLKELRAQERAAAEHLAAAQRAHAEAEARVFSVCDDLAALGVPGYQIADIR